MQQNNLKEYKIIVPDESTNTRLDVFLHNYLENEMSRSFIQKLIKTGNIKVNNKIISKQNYKVMANDEIFIKVPPPEPTVLKPLNIPLNILFEDEHLAIIHKPAGMVVHPGNANMNNTLVHALLAHFKGLSSIGGIERPGIVHRLDKDTEGLMIIAKNDIAHNRLSLDFKNRRIKKIYHAVVIGKPLQKHTIIDKPIKRHPKYRNKMTVSEDGREAITKINVKDIWHTDLGVFSFLELNILTGRTHQIRVHLSSSGLPIVGDPIYSKKSSKYHVPYLLLAATSITFEHPISKTEMQFEIELPVHIKSFINKLNKIAKEHLLL